MHFIYQRCVCMHTELTQVAGFYLRVEMTERFILVFQKKLRQFGDNLSFDFKIVSLELLSF